MLTKWIRSGTHLLWKILALFWARKYAGSILRGHKRYEANILSEHTQNPVGPPFVLFKKTGEYGRSDFFFDQENGGRIRSVRIA